METHNEMAMKALSEELVSKGIASLVFGMFVCGGAKQQNSTSFFDAANAVCRSRSEALRMQNCT
ncbi:hypothetical protein AB6D10_22895 [Vibrio splendidus]